MLPKPVLLVALLVASVSAQYGVAGMYENLPLESTTAEASGEGSGYNNGNDNGYASGADAVAIDTDCSNKEDGLYAIGGCSPQFLTCSGGISRVMDCPANLIYDHRIVACEYSYNVPECSGVPQDVTSTQSYYSAGEETTPSEDVTLPTETTVNPYAPVDVEATTTPAKDITVPVETTASPYAPVNPYVTAAPASDEPVTRAAVEKSCAGKADGFYSFGECSDHYIACSNGYTIPMQCPARLAFDEARVICDYTMNVRECQNGSGYDEGSAEETTTEASGELPYSNGYGYEETTTAGEDVPSTDSYAPRAEAYAAPYGIESTTAADIPTTTVGYTPEVVETTTVPYVEETTTVPYVEETTTAADVPTTTIGYPPVTETTTVPYVEEITTVADVPTTTVGYTPEVIETTTAPYVEETTTVADVPTTTVGYTPEVVETTTAPYVEETTTVGYTPEVVETTTAPYVEETTTAADVPTTTVGYTPEVVETTTAPYVEETTTVGYTPEVVETTTAPYVEETTTAADVPTTTVGYTPEVVETTTAPYVEETTTTTTDYPSCIEGATAIEPCSQHYRNCVNGQEAIFICESGLFFSPEQGRCTSTDQIAECHQTKLY